MPDGVDTAPGRRAGRSAGAVQRLDHRFRPVIGQAEGKAAERHIGLERRSDLLKQIVERGIASSRVALLDVDLDLDIVPVVGGREAAQGLLRLTRITVPQDDQPAGRYLLRHRAVPFDFGVRDCPE